MISWLSDSKDGFSIPDIEYLRKAQSYLGLIAKVSNREPTAQNVANAYLGKDAVQRVLKGQIKLGNVERIPAIVWFSDLRKSTALAAEISAEQYLNVLNTYFECSAGAVLDYGGKVLSFIGDGVLAVFPITIHATITASASNVSSAQPSASEFT
ncbi:MAG: adenylate cyclase [Granulosicoccus sp.]|jgi:adenylate cyclase